MLDRTTQIETACRAIVNAKCSRLAVPLLLFLTALAARSVHASAATSSADEVSPHPMQQAAKWGYGDLAGKFVIKPQFEAAKLFSEGLAAVKMNKRFGYIALDGHFVIPPKYVTAAPFKEGIALVGTRKPITPFGTGEYGFAVFAYMTYIDRSGIEIRSPLSVESANSFSEGLAAVRPGKSWGGCDKAGYINKLGEWSIKPQFSAVRDFLEGLAAVTREGDCHSGARGRWGYIDKDGAPRISPRFDFAGQFRHGYACVKESAQWSLIDSTGTGKVVGLVDCFKHYELFAEHGDGEAGTRHSR